MPNYAVVVRTQSVKLKAFYSIVFKNGEHLVVISRTWVGTRQTDNIDSQHTERTRYYRHSPVIIRSVIYISIATNANAKTYTAYGVAIESKTTFETTEP